MTFKNENIVPLRKHYHIEFVYPYVKLYYIQLTLRLSMLFNVISQIQKQVLPQY